MYSIIIKVKPQLKTYKMEDVATLRGVPLVLAGKGEIGGRAALTQGDGDTHHYLHIFSQHCQRCAHNPRSIKSITLNETLDRCY